MTANFDVNWLFTLDATNRLPWAKDDLTYDALWYVNATANGIDYISNRYVAVRADRVAKRSWKALSSRVLDWPAPPAWSVESEARFDPAVLYPFIEAGVRVGAEDPAAPAAAGRAGLFDCDDHIGYVMSLTDRADNFGAIRPAEMREHFTLIRMAADAMAHSNSFVSGTVDLYTARRCAAISALSAAGLLE